MMNRREAMVRLGLLAASGLVPSLAKATKDQLAELSTSAFASSFQDVPSHYPETRIRFDKALPQGLSGTLFRNGPALMQRGEQRYQHWFDGDGMIQSFRISGQELVHQGRMVHTSRFEAESAAGRILWPGFGTAFPGSLAVREPDDMNVANISVLPVEDELLALWEGGSAWRIDPHTLATKGKKVFSSDTQGLPFSAHPSVDTDGRIWNFGYMSGSGKLVLYELTNKAKLKRVQIIDAPNADMVHDFAITQRYLIFVLTPVRYHNSDTKVQQSFLQQMQWDSTAPVVVMLIDKHSLQTVHQFEMDSFFAFHFGNAYEDGDNVRIDVARAPAFEDEALLRTSLRNELQKAWPELKIVSEASNGQQALKRLKEPGISVAFLDIQMPGLTGLEVAQQLLRDWPNSLQSNVNNWPPLLVFVTAFGDFALEAFEGAAVDYVLKPVTPKRLSMTVSRLQARLSERNNTPAGVDTSTLQALAQQLHQLTNEPASIPTHTAHLKLIRAGIGDTVRMIPIDEVVLFEAADKYVVVHTAQGESLIRESLRELSSQLDSSIFQQLHRSSIVNMQVVKAALRDETGKIVLQLNGVEKQPVVSRNYAHLFKAM